MTATHATTQSMQALERANEVRMAGAGFKKQVHHAGRHHGRRLAGDVLRAVPDGSGPVVAYALVMAIPYVGRAKARRWFRLADVPHDARLCELTERQRSALAALLEVEA